MGRIFGNKKQPAREDNYDDDMPEPPQLPAVPAYEKSTSNISKPQVQQRIVEVEINNAYLNEKLNLILSLVQGLSTDMKELKEEALK